MTLTIIEPAPSRKYESGRRIDSTSVFNNKEIEQLIRRPEVFSDISQVGEKEKPE